jgi:hypothetical protein
MGRPAAGLDQRSAGSRDVGMNPAWLGLLIPLASLYHAGNIGRRLLLNRTKFATSFPDGMQRAVISWWSVAVAIFLSGPALLAGAAWLELPPLRALSLAISLYTAIWTGVGRQILTSQREYARWLRHRKAVIRFLQTPVDRRPAEPPSVQATFISRIPKRRQRPSSGTAPT